ncbi:MAG: hypothetical protein KGZ58_01680 [Ignavibacteriales bacterium]|nr:hypothetical protein [Ignavibacteriales bacterium]
MKILIPILFILLANISFSQSQYERITHSSVTRWRFSADDEAAIGIITNPATLGLDRQTDLWYTTVTKEKRFLEHNFFVQTPFLFGNFGATYRKAFDDVAKNSADAYGFGFGVGSSSFSVGFFTDYVASKTEAVTLSNLGFLYQPSGTFSLSYVIKNINEPSTPTTIFAQEQTFGISIRPASSERIVLFADVLTERNRWYNANLHLGVKYKLNAVSLLYVSYFDQRNESNKLYSLGIRFLFSQSTLFGIVTSGQNTFPETSLGAHITNSNEEER